MSGLTADKMTNLYADLTSQISKSVKNISQKSAFSHSVAVPENPKEQPLTASVNFSGYAFSYLEPSSLYNLHRINADLTNEEKLKGQNRRQNQVAENGRQEQPAENDNLEQIATGSFMEELQNSFKPAARFVTKIYQQNSLNKVSEMPLFLSGANFTANDVKYANNAYNFTFNLNNMPDMRIEYMHKYNRSFDYRI